MTTKSLLESKKTYIQIKHKLKEHLLESKPDDGRLPPIKELAANLGLGQTSTHMAIKELVREGFLVSRPKLGTFINETRMEMPNAQQVAGLVAQDKLLAGKMIQTLYRSKTLEGFLARILNAFTDELTARGAICEKHRISNEPELDFAEILNRKYDAVMVLNPHAKTSLKTMPGQMLTVIDTTNDYRLIMNDRFDAVSLDEYQGSFLAGDYVRRQGCNDVCFLGVPVDINDSENFRYDRASQTRLDGFEAGFGQKLPQDALLFSLSYSIINGAAFVNQWIKLNPRHKTIFAASDDIAVGFINGAAAHGLKIGTDYNIIGFDGQYPDPIPTLGVLSSVAAPTADMGSLAAKMLTERLINPNIPPRRTMLGCTLIEGDTVKKQTSR